MAYVSVTNELTGDHWPSRYEKICIACLFSYREHGTVSHGVLMRLTTETATSLSRPTTAASCNTVKTYRLYT